MDIHKLKWKIVIEFGTPTGSNIPSRRKKMSGRGLTDFSKTDCEDVIRQTYSCVFLSRFSAASDTDRRIFIVSELFCFILFVR